MSLRAWRPSGWDRESTAVVGAYTAMNVIVRGGLALLSLYVVLDLRLPAGTAALLLAYSTLVLRFGRTLTAPLVAKAGPRLSTAAGFLAVAAGYLLIGARPDAGPVWVGVTLVGFGFGTCMLTLKVLFTAGSGSAMTQRLAYLALAVNVGAAIGPLAAAGVATALSRQHAYGLLGAVAAGTALVVTPWIRDPAGRPTGSAPVRSRWSPWQLLRRPRIVALLAVVLLGTAFYAQLVGLLPLLLAQVEGSGARAGSLVGTVFGVNSVTVIALQVPLTALVQRAAALRRFAVAGAMVLYGAAFAILLVAGGLWTVLAGVLCMSIAECLALPLVEADLAAGIDPADLLTVFALSALAMGLGDALGTLAGVGSAAHGPASMHDFLLALVVVAVVVGLLDAALSRRLHALTVPAPDVLSAPPPAGPHRPHPEDGAARTRSGSTEGPRP